ncbi:MAG: hypothetical protein KAI29_26610, partial [Cyclobacteriaceae bacterium]|nr:hypothetical protein [Cyclobacteriaceae bacterium]
MLIGSLRIQTWSDSITGIFNQMRLPLLIAAMLILLTSCYSDYVHLKYETSNDPVSVFHYGDSNQVAFVSTQEAYLRAKGITAFPDGGQVKVIYKETGLYICDIKNSKATLLVNVPNTPYLLTDTKLVYVNDVVYYCCEIDTSKSIDSVLFSSLNKKYVKAFSIDTKTKEVSALDTAKFNLLYQKYNKKCGLSVLNKELKKIPLSEFGLVVQDNYPKSDKAYIE